MLNFQLWDTDQLGNDRWPKSVSETSKEWARERVKRRLRMSPPPEKYEVEDFWHKTDECPRDLRFALRDCTDYITSLVLAELQARRVYILP